MVEPATKMTTRRLNDMGLGFMHSGTLVAAIKLGLFDALSEGPLDLRALAARLALSEDRAEKLVAACAALDLVERAQGTVANTAETDRFLVRSRKTFFGDYLVHLAEGSYENWSHLADKLREKPASGPGRYYLSGNDAAAARALTEAGYTGSQGLARRLAHRFDFSPYHRLLDLGGGSAVYSIEACRGNPRLRSTVLDFEHVCEVAREFIAKAELSDRIEARAFDFTRDPLPAGADVILLCGNIHAYDRDTARGVVRRSFAALPSRGAMILCDYMLNDQRTGPPVAAFINLSQIWSSGGGGVHSGADFRGYLEAAGFRVERVEEFLEGSMGWAVGIKP
jgi:hypothetical protein